MLMTRSYFLGDPAHRQKARLSRFPIGSLILADNRWVERDRAMLKRPPHTRCSPIRVDEREVPFHALEARSPASASARR